MDAQGNGLTLEGLAQTLETLQHEHAENARRLRELERENEQMRAGNADLRGKVTALDGSEGATLNSPEGHL
jgi:cell division protein FtsB